VISREIISAEHRRRLAALGDRGCLLIADSRPIVCALALLNALLDGDAEHGDEAPSQQERRQSGQEPGQPDPRKVVRQVRYHGPSRMNETLKKCLNIPIHW
jgi:hypothetical protein